MTDETLVRSSKTCTHGNPVGTAWGPCSLCELEENTRLRRVMTVVADRTSDDTAAQMLRQHLGAAHETRADCSECGAKWALDHDQYCQSNRHRPGETGGGLQLKAFVPPNRNHSKDCPCYECANLRMCRVCGHTDDLHHEWCTIKAVAPPAVEDISHWWKCLNCHARNDPATYPVSCPCCATLRPTENGNPPA